MIFLTVCALVLAVPILQAQTPDLSGGSVVIKRLSVDEGLSNRLVRGITQDSRGFIWVGTGNGVNRYDGEKFTSIRSGKDSMTISHENVWGGVCGDKEGIMWVGTTRGLNKFNPETRSFKKYFHDPRDPKSLSSDSINCVFIDREGTLWVGTVFGLNKLNRETDIWTSYFPNLSDSSRPGENYISAILEDQKGKFWIATGGSNDLLTGGGLFTLDRNTGAFTAIGPRVGIRTLYEDRSGDLWVSLVGPRLCKVDRSTGAFVTIPLPPRDEGNPRLQGIKGICEDKSGFLWMATSGWSLLRYDKQQKTFTRYSYDPQNSESISSSGISAVFADNEGLLWVGTDRGGVNTVSKKPFKHLHTLGNSLRLSSRVDVVFQDREGFLWVGSQGNGVWRYNPTSGKSSCILPTGLAREILQDNEGTIWIADRYSVVRYNPKTRRSTIAWEVPTVRGVRDRLLTMIFDKEQNLWLGGNSALYRISRNMKEYRVFTHDKQNERTITAGQVHSLAEDRSGNIWVGTETGISRYNKSSGSLTRFLHDDNDSLSLSDNRWPRTHIDKNGTVWIGTSLGLNRFNETDSTFTRFFPAGKNLPRYISDIEEDTKGFFWYALQGTVMRFNPSDGTFACFDRSDGIEDVEVLDWSHAQLNSGEMLFGTYDGILAFHPDSLKRQASVPPIVITGIKRLNQGVRTSCMPELLREISFTHEENVFSISFSALSFEMPEYNQYAYKLDGFNADWVRAGNRREAMYTNLDPGEYTFHVKASNHDDVWNDAGATLRIIIRPAYWQTWWFRSLTACALVAMVFFAYRRKVALLQKDKRIQQQFSHQQILFQETERKRIASDIHDGLGQDLLIAQNELQQFLQEKSRSQNRLKQVAGVIQQSIESAREIASNLHPHQLDRLGFCSAVRALARTLAHSSGILIDAACENMDGLLSKDAELHLYRIIQEALANAVRHAAAKHIHVELRKEAGFVLATVRDDGKGFDHKRPFTEDLPDSPEEKRHGFGLSSMAERVRIIGGSLTIDSAAGRGTTISIRIPCK